MVGNLYLVVYRAVKARHAERSEASRVFSEISIQTSAREMLRLRLCMTAF